ncbi:sigma-70 family RNA polymerase sigma factor [Tsukamurella sp. PLM1]|uniref:sigma-70 family RNA polymerase sigma factor n=1 Tax=Tsukamurella sp. PLM1 TaxID=2929795 RepID=UPI0020C09EF4|nr:sigma-70 family RNA polymerase sigma factor [Tsukamurella sp. PLM1]
MAEVGGAVTGGTVLDEAVLAELRPELVRYCYRMIGDGAAAEDAAQEVLLRLWRTRDTYDPTRAGIRTWAYAIASRYCIDLLRAAPRRALPTDLSERNGVGDQAFTELRPGSWVTPLPDAGGDPAAAAERHESIRMAFVAALQHLTPAQRAVLVLRDVYRHSAAETAEILGISAAAAHSSLQRARRVLAAAGTAPSDVPAREVDARLLDGFVRAFDRHDVAGRRPSSRRTWSSPCRPSPSGCGVSPTTRRCSARATPASATASSRRRRTAHRPSGSTRPATRAGCARSPSSSSSPTVPASPA